MSKREKIIRTCECLKGIVHPIRLGIVCELESGPMNVTQLKNKLGVSQSNLSQHLSFMKLAQILTQERNGNQIFYQVADTRIFKLLELMKEVFCK